jgi:biotin carboxyl carrier protein
MTSTRVTIRAGDSSATVEWQPDPQDARTTIVQVDGEREPLRVERLQSGTYRVTQGEQSWPVYAAATRDACWIFVNGRVLTLEVSSERGHRRSSVGAHEALSAPMPATVIKILVEAGQAVKKGDTLILLEAMKMELPVRAPGDGTVAAVRCREGELVQPGTALLEFE